MGKVKKNQVQQKTVLITGGTQGIGLGIALKFLEKGYFVIICARNPPNGEIFGDQQKSTLFLKCDIGNSDSRNYLIEQIKEKVGRIDILVNNAGIAPPVRQDILIATEDSYDQVLNTNLKGPYFLTQAVANFMLELQKQNTISNYQPSIITISSISAFTSSTSRGDYCISKAGLSMLTKLFADRLAEYEIPVFEIQPGIITTPMTMNVKEKYDKMIREGLLPISRWGTPEDIGIAAVALAERNIPYSTGQVLNLDGGFHLHRL